MALASLGAALALTAADALAAELDTAQTCARAPNMTTTTATRRILQVQVHALEGKEERRQEVNQEVDSRVIGDEGRRLERPRNGQR
jgi:hypothetical protein